jgi:hypothetical protein
MKIYVKYYQNMYVTFLDVQLGGFTVPAIIRLYNFLLGNVIALKYLGMCIIYLLPSAHHFLTPFNDLRIPMYDF